MTDSDATQTRQDDAAKQLRTMLDERGVKWRKWIYGNIDLGTIFSASGIEWIALWNPKINKLSITNYKIDLTPEQAIAATVAQDLFIHGPEMNEQTCTIESMHGFTDAHVRTRYFVELSCHTIDDWGDSEPPKFCPYCRRKVIDQDARDLRDAIATDDGKCYSMGEVMELIGEEE